MKKMLAVSAILLLLIGLTVAVSWASEIHTIIDAYGACAFSETLTTPFAQFNQSAAVTGPSSYLYVEQWAWTDWGAPMEVTHYVEAYGCSVDYHQDIGLQVEDAFLMTAGLDISGKGPESYFELTGYGPPFSITKVGYDDGDGLLVMFGELWAEFVEGSITLAHYLQANCCYIDLKYVLDDDPISYPPMVKQTGIVTPGDSYGFLFTIFLVEQGIDLAFLIDDEAWCDWGP